MKKKVVAPPAAAGLLAETNLGWHLAYARVSSDRQRQADCVYEERMSDGYIRGE